MEARLRNRKSDREKIMWMISSCFFRNGSLWACDQSPLLYSSFLTMTNQMLRAHLAKENSNADKLCHLKFCITDEISIMSRNQFLDMNTILSSKKKSERSDEWGNIWILAFGDCIKSSPLVRIQFMCHQKVATV